MIYLIIFTISLIFIYMAAKIKNKKISLLLSFVGIMLPCILAALRSIDIGTDVQVYVYPLYKTSLKYDNFLTFFKYPYSTINDVLYLLTTYIGSKITKNISGVFFLNQLFVILPIYVAINKKFKKPEQIVFAMFIYYFLLYNISLNIARQSIAVALSILALTYLDSNKNIKYLFISFIAFLFHKSAIIMIPLFIIQKILREENKNMLAKKICKVFIFLVVIISILFLPALIKLIIKAGIYSDKFTGILKFARNIDINFIDTLLYIIIFFVISINKFFLIKINKNFEFYYFLSFIAIFTLQLGSIVKYSDRIGMYIFYPAVFLILPYISTFNIKKQISKNRFICCLFIIVSIICYWIFWIIIVKRHQTFPYIFNNF